MEVVHTMPRRRLAPAAYVSALALAAFTAAAPIAASAEDPTPADLAGWWLAIDEVQPEFWQAHPVVPAEELLVIDASGRADTRMMVFTPVHPGPCDQRGACSDAPRLQHADFAVTGDLLTFKPPTKDDEVHVLTNVVALRPIVVTSAPAWLARLSGGGVMLFLQQPNESGARAFARIDPVELGRIRAAYQNIPAADSFAWRCFLAHATAGDPAFLPLYRGESPPPAWFPAFLKAASYVEAVDTTANKPPPSMTDALMKAWSEAPLETILIEKFPDTAFPKTAAETNTLYLKSLYLQARLDGMDDAAARASIADKAKGETITLAISEEEAATLAKAKTDPEIRKMNACQ